MPTVVCAVSEESYEMKKKITVTNQLDKHKNALK
jgi:hypothetical protein